MNYIINLFGTGIRYWNCELEQIVFDDMNRIRLKNMVEWEQVLFNLEFLNHYGFSHWSELSSEPAIVGFLLDAQNRIELKQKSKLITRFRASELGTAATLFPLYDTSFIQESFFEKPTIKSFQLIQFEKGLIGKFKFESDAFSIEQLHYVLSSIGKKTFLTSITIEKIALISSQEDGLVTGGEVVF